MAKITDKLRTYPEGSFGIPSIFRLPQEQSIKKQTPKPSNIHLVNLDEPDRTIGKLKIQTVPLNLSVTPTTQWAVIPVLGRNLPRYQYTGGETKIRFQLDWYSVTPLRDDVIDRCRWVESLSRSDGWNAPPPRILLIFGDLFKNQTWVVESAPYELSLFDKEWGMLPRQAYQELTLMQVSDTNITHFDIKRPTYAPLGELMDPLGAGDYNRPINNIV
jgi:hypothetical protein